MTTPTAPSSSATPAEEADPAGAAPIESEESYREACLRYGPPSSGAGAGVVDPCDPDLEGP